MTLCSRTCLLLASLALAMPAAAAPAPAPPSSGKPPAPQVPPGKPPAPGAAQPSPGCQSYTITMGTQKLRVSVTGVSRDIAVVVPTGARPQNPLPLVIAWHDTGGSGGLARVYFGVEQQSVAQAIFVYPEAAAAGGKRGAWDTHPEGADVRFFDRLLAEAGSQLCVDLSRVYSVGHGAGADLTRVLACSRASALRGAATVGGGAPAECAARATRTVPALHIPGKDWGPTSGPKIWKFLASLR